jgi:hypothetical protein
VTRALAVFLFLAPAGAQSYLVAPNLASYRSAGSAAAAYVFPGSATASTPSHTLVLYDCVGLTQPAATLRAVSARRSAGGSTSLPQSMITLRLRCSMSPRPHDQISATFQDNLGSQLTTVFDGTWRLSSRSPTSWPAPWETELPFTTPFPFARSAGQSLAVDFQVTNNASRTTWLADAQVVERGTAAVELQQTTCLHSGGQANNAYGADVSELYPTGWFRFQVLNLPRESASLGRSMMFFGAQGRGGTYAGRTLPFSLLNAGVPSNTGCQWSIDILTSAPMLYDENAGTLSTTFRILPDPILVEKPVFTQALCLDTDAITRQYEFIPSVAMRWTVGTGKRPPCSTVQVTQDTVPPRATGTVRIGEGIVLRLRY